MEQRVVRSDNSCKSYILQWYAIYKRISSQMESDIKTVIDVFL